MSANKPLFSHLNSLVYEGLEEAVKKLSKEEQQKFFESEKLDSVLNDSVSDIASTFVAKVNKEAAKDFRRDKRYQKRFERRLARRFNPYFKELYGLTNLCIEVIQHHRDYIHEHKVIKNKKQASQYGVIIRLHARALRICNEVRSLMEAGYATGALSRWRALHELTATINFLTHNLDAVELFLEHDKVLSYEAMLDLNKYSDLLVLEAYTNHEVAMARRIRKNLINKHGNDIKHPYGWLKVYSHGKIKTFRDLEEQYGQEQLRPYYRYASYGIHANAKSLRSGEENSALENENVILVGASDGGMEEVAQLTPISISFATISILCNLSPSAASIVAARTVMLKQEQLRDTFTNVSLPDAKTE